MSDAKSKLGLEVVLLSGTMAVLCLFSMIPALIWFTIDDMTATLVGVPSLGDLPFLYVWPLCFMLSCVFKGQGSSKSD